MPAWSTNTNLTHRVSSGNDRAMSSLASRSACIAPPKMWPHTFPLRNDAANISRFGLPVHRIRPYRKPLSSHQRDSLEITDFLRIALALRFRGGDVAVESEDIVWVVADLEGDEAFPVLRGMSGLYPLCTRALELHKVDVGVAGLEGTRRLGHAGEVSHNTFRHLRREGRPDPVHDELGVTFAHGAQAVGRARQGATELPELQHDQGRARIGAGDLHERFDGLGRELAQHLGVLAGPHRVDRVHAHGVHRREWHSPEGVHDRLAQLLAHGTHQLLAGPGILPAVA